MMYIMGKELVQLVETSCCSYDGRYGTAATKLHGVSSQDATAFPHTPVGTTRFNNTKDHSLLVQLKVSPRHFK